MKLEDIYFAYSYERVTPGDNYYNSISNYIGLCWYQYKFSKQM